MTREAGMVLLLATACIAGCGDIVGVCTTQLESNLIVEVRDAVSGEPAARGATGLAEYTSTHEFTELFSFFDDVQLFGNWNREAAGLYVVHLQKPGFKTEHVSATVTEDRCHVRTARVPVRLARDSAAVAIPPLSVERGARVAGSPASVGIRVFGDTLVVSGRAFVRCGEVDIVSFRANTSWHIQLQPSQWNLECPGTASLQQFEARFRLLPGNNQVLITNAIGFPMTLFDGSVAPLSP